MTAGSSSDDARAGLMTGMRASNRSSRTTQYQAARTVTAALEVLEDGVLPHLHATCSAAVPACAERGGASMHVCADPHAAASHTSGASVKPYSMLAVMGSAYA